MIRVDRERCTGCGACMDVCPESAIYLADGEVTIHSDLCKACGTCVEICPVGALSMDHESLPVLQQTGQKVGEIEVIQLEPGPESRLAPWAGFALAILDRWLVPRVVEALVDTMQRRLVASEADESRPVASTRYGRGSRGGGSMRRRRRQRRMCKRGW
jgi:dissimilatory sulfite reductase (desulfoviridin) alpha/beta subunit